MLARLMGLKTVSPRELQQLIETRAVTVFDVNPAAKWQTAHVSGARHLDPEEYNEGDLPSDKNAGLVFYCSNPMCRKAPNAARRAKKMGYCNVRVLSAGINRWVGAGLTTEAAQ